MRFKKHICESEDHCKVCIDYINSLDKEVHIPESFSVSDNRSQASMGKRHINKHKWLFDLPKPRLARSLINME